jgi:hypothetical protein
VFYFSVFKAFIVSFFLLAYSCKIYKHTHTHTHRETERERGRERERERERERTINWMLASSQSSWMGLLPYKMDLRKGLFPFFEETARRQPSRKQEVGPSGHWICGAFLYNVIWYTWMYFHGFFSKNKITGVDDMWNFSIIKAC